MPEPDQLHALENESAPLAATTSSATVIQDQEVELVNAIKIHINADESEEPPPRVDVNGATSHKSLNGHVEPQVQLRNTDSSVSSSHVPVVPPTVASCFSSEYLSTPLFKPVSDVALTSVDEANAQAKHLFGTPPPKLNLAWNNLNLFVPAPTPTDPTAKKKILSNVSGRAFAGETIAIMGPSGSGKTSLLKLLAGGWRKAKETNMLDGDLSINGKPVLKRTKRFMAYVEQDDVMMSNLTVEQTLSYSALLNLPKHFSREEKLDRVEQTIEILGLTKCRGTKIGFGISGGERKRTSIASEMLSNPSIIIADEPTSGLDSTTAARLIHTLRNLARGGRTILCSIHQPSSQTFALFDKVLLLAQGRMIYYGSTSTVVNYFASTGLMCRPHFNPADFFLEIVADLTPDMIAKEEAAEEARQKGDIQNGYKNGTTKDTEKSTDVVVSMMSDLMPEASSFDGSDASKQVIRQLPIIFSKIHHPLMELEDASRARIEAKISSKDEAAVDEPEATDRWPLNWFQQFVLLLSRAFIQHKGGLVTWVFFCQMFFSCVGASIVWFQTSDDIEALTDRTGCLFFIVMFWTFSPLFNALVSFPSELPVIRKDRAKGSYRLSAYFVGKVVSESPIILGYATGFTIIYYWMVAFQPHPGQFFAFLATILLTTVTSQALGLCISCLITNFTHAITFASVLVMQLTLLSGYFVRLSNIPIWLRWANHLCYPKYVYGLIGYIQFHGFTFPCRDGVVPYGSGYTSCPVRGEEIMHSYDFDLLPLWANAVILIGLSIAFRVIAYWGLRRNTATA